MKLPVKSIAAFVASPQGRRMMKRARARIDTPENRERLSAAVARARGRSSTGAAVRPR